MALQNTLTVSAATTGQGDAQYPSQQIVNTNAAPPGAATLQGGNVQILCPPSGYVVNGVWIKPPPNSTNAKILKGVAGDTGSASFTSAPMMYPAAAGGSFYINSAGSESVELIWF